MWYISNWLLLVLLCVIGAFLGKYFPSSTFIFTTFILALGVHYFTEEFKLLRRDAAKNPATNNSLRFNFSYFRDNFALSKVNFPSFDTKFNESHFVIVIVYSLYFSMVVSAGMLIYLGTPDSMFFEIGLYTVFFAWIYCTGIFMSGVCIPLLLNSVCSSVIFCNLPKKHYLNRIDFKYYEDLLGKVLENLFYLNLISCGGLAIALTLSVPSMLFYSASATALLSLALLVGHVLAIFANKGFAIQEALKSTEALKATEADTEALEVPTLSLKIIPLFYYTNIGKAAIALGILVTFSIIPKDIATIYLFVMGALGVLLNDFYLEEFDKHLFHFKK